jgi:hypothetical protein
VKLSSNSTPQPNANEWPVRAAETLRVDLDGDVEDRALVAPPGVRLVAPAELGVVADEGGVGRRRETLESQGPVRGFDQNRDKCEPEEQRADALPADVSP